MKQRTRAIVGGVIGLVTGVVIGYPVTMILVFNIYWDKPGPPIGVTAFTALVWGGFIASGLTVGGLTGRYSVPENEERL